MTNDINFYFIMETSEEAIDLKTGEEFHLCISGKAKDLSIFFFIISFCPALLKRALDQYFEMSVCLSVCLCVCLCVCLSVTNFQASDWSS